MRQNFVEKKQIMNEEFKKKVGKHVAWEQSCDEVMKLKHSDAVWQQEVEKSWSGCEKKMKDYHRPMRWHVRFDFKCVFLGGTYTLVVTF